MTKDVIPATTRIRCDECNKVTMFQEGGFPYNLGWIFLYNFEFKEIQNCSNKSKEKHFCNKACMVKYVVRQMTKKNDG